MDEKKVVLSANNISKTFNYEKGEKFYACKNINIELYKGQTLSIVGESGCGKSTLAKILLNLIEPDTGSVYYNDINLTSLRGEKLRHQRRFFQAVFQDIHGSFNPRMKIKHIITATLINYKEIRKNEIDKRAKELLELVQLPAKYIDKYPHELSGGERQRASIARALAIKPEALICDEATSALDVTIQNKVIDMLVDLQKKMNLSIIFISHDLVLSQSISHQIVVMYNGIIVEKIEGRKISKEARHPYTLNLLDSIFSVDMDFNKEISSITIENVNIKDQNCCNYHKRCKFVNNKCRNEKPQLSLVSYNHYNACFLNQFQ